LALSCAGCSGPVHTTAPISLSNDRSPSWSPVGDSVAFVHVKVDQTDAVASGIYLVSALGGHPRLVLETNARSLSWRSDGHALVFDSAQGLFTCTAMGDSLKLLLGASAYFPSWSPSGNYIAYDDVSNVWLLDVPNGTTRTVTDSLGGGRAPSWAPDERALVVTSHLPGNYPLQLVILAADGRVLRRLDDASNEDYAPAWSPSGAHIAWNRWVRDAAGTFHPQYWVVDTAGTTRLHIADGEGRISWSPDGSHLVFVGINGRLFTSLATGAGARQITF